MKGGRILVIDDEPMVREAVGRMLMAEGYAVDHAHDGAAALALVDADAPDVILLDLMMPGMNGRQFLASLRDDRHSDVPVVVMTAVHGLAQRAVDLGATDVVEKPFDLDELLNKVALAVFRSRRGRPRAATLPPLLPVRPPPPTTGQDLGEQVVVVIDRDLAALDHLDDLLTRHGFTVVPIARLTDDLGPTLRALAPALVVLGCCCGQDLGATATALRTSAGLGDVPILAWRRGHDAAPPPGDRVDVSLSRPTDDDLVRTVSMMSVHARID